MRKQIEIKCRQGITYSIKASGSEGSLLRLQKMLQDCCCYVCHNHNCHCAIDGKQPCNRECELYTKTPFCENRGDKK